MTDAELRALLIDCATLWGVQAQISVGEQGLEISTKDLTCLIQRAPYDMRPVRWLLHTPDRRAANRPPRALPSIVAMLTALRNVLGAEAGNKLVVGSGRGPAISIGAPAP